MRLTFKNILTIVIVIAMGIATYVVYKHFTNQTKAIPNERDNARDSLNYYLEKQSKAVKEYKISTDSLTYYANRIDTLNKMLAVDSFGSDVLRSMLRSRIQDTIVARQIRDSSGRQHP